jgi:PPM family protein phosphatase
VPWEHHRPTGCCGIPMTSPYQYVHVSASNRERSEDAAEVFECGDSLVLALADGAGGIHGGATASRALVAAVRSAVKDPASSITDARYWAELLRMTDAALAKHSGGETTGIVVVLSKGKLVGVSTGDSEAWVISSKGVDDLTVSQNTHQRLGSGSAVPTTFERGPLADVLLIASDGLFRYAAMDVIARAVRGSPIGVAAEQLIELVRLRSGKFHDDMAAILVARKSATLSS